MASTLDLLKRLREHGVEFLLVGGMASALYGSSLLTQDVDVCFAFTEDNLARLLRALSGLNPRQRMTPSRPALSEDPAAYAGWKNLYVISDWGTLDLLSSIPGAGDYDTLVARATTVDLGGFTCQVIGLDDLIASKRAMGRPKDLRAAAELEVIRTRQDRDQK